MTNKNISDKPKRLVIELSHNCNLNCIMCGFGGKVINKKKFIEKRIVEKLSLEKDFFSDINEIRLNGRGESTINPDFPKLVTLIKNIFPRSRLSMTTNLMFKNDKIMDLINENNIELVISIDSPEKEKYEFIRKGANYKTLIRRINKIKKGHVIFTLQKYNINDIKNMGEFTAKLNLGFILNVIRVDDEKYKKEFTHLLSVKWNSLLQQVEALHNLIPFNKLFIPDQIWGKKIPDELVTTKTSGSLPICPNVKDELMISYNGVIHPCCMFNPFIYGNIAYDNLIQSIWNSYKRKTFINSYKTNQYCQHCEYMIHE